MATYDSSYDNSPITRVVLTNSSGQPLPSSSSGGGDVNLTQVAGTAVDVNSGNKSAGTLRVILATDQPSVGTNLATIAGTATSVNVGTSDAGTQRVTLGSGTQSIGNVAGITTSITPGTGATNLGKAVDAAAGATDTGVVALRKRVDTPATVTPANGDYLPGQSDSLGHAWSREGFAPAAEDNTNAVIAVQHKPVASATYSATGFTAPLTDVDISVKGSAGNLKSLSASNINAAIRYLQVFNKATAPAGGDTAVFSWPIPAGTSTAPAVVEIGQDFLGNGGYYFSTGIAVGISTVAATFTGATTTDHVTNGTYV